MEAFVFGQELAAFWGDYESYDVPDDDKQEIWDVHVARKRSEAEAAGKRANDAKMAGFYVDMDDSGESVLSPTDVEAGTIAEDLRTAAQVIEMLLIKDHSRMKFEAHQLPTTAPTSSSIGSCRSRIRRTGPRRRRSSGTATTSRTHER